MRDTHPRLTDPEQEGWREKVIKAAVWRAFAVPRWSVQFELGLCVRFFKVWLWPTRAIIKCLKKTL